MQQLDTGTWFITILSMILKLYIIMQLKSSKHLYYFIPECTIEKTKHSTPWENTMNENLFYFLLPLQ